MYLRYRERKRKFEIRYLFLILYLLNSYEGGIRMAFNLILL